jgi:hypothetical protein
LVEPFSFGFDVLCHVSLQSRSMPRYFTSLFWARSTLPFCTVRQVWLPRVNVICLDLLWSIITLHFFTQLLILLMVAWSFIETIGGSSCVDKIAVSSAKVAVVVLSDVGSCLCREDIGRVARHFLAVLLLQLSLRLWFCLWILLERVYKLDMILIFCNIHGEGFLWFWTRVLGAILYQSSTQTHMDLWNSAMGDSIEFQHRNPPVISREFHWGYRRSCFKYK